MKRLVLWTAAAAAALLAYCEPLRAETLELGASYYANRAYPAVLATYAVPQGRMLAAFLRTDEKHAFAGLLSEVGLTGQRLLEWGFLGAGYRWTDRLEARTSEPVVGAGVRYPFGDRYNARAGYFQFGAGDTDRVLFAAVSLEFGG